MSDPKPVAEYAPCPICRQYSHSIDEDDLADAFMHFQSMIAHPVRGHPMGDAFDERTQWAAQVLVAAAKARTAQPPEDVAGLVTQADRDAACGFFANWPRITIPDYLPDALAESFAAHRTAAISAVADQLREEGVKAGLEAAAKAILPAAYDPAPFTRCKHAIGALSAAEIARGIGEQ